MSSPLKTFENKHIQSWIEDDILYGIYKKHSIITLNVAKQNVKERLEWQQGKEYKCLLFANFVQLMTPDARKYLAKNEGITKLAIVVQSDFLITVGKVFIDVDKPRNPTRLFKTREEAEKWLRED